jgi:hypothetical protein
MMAELKHTVWDIGILVGDAKEYVTYSDQV